MRHWQWPTQQQAGFCNTTGADSVSAQMRWLECSGSSSQEQFVVSQLLPSLRQSESVPTYLEIGGSDGIQHHASNTLFLQHCLSWRGIVIEKSPSSFRQLVANRPQVVAIGSGICRTHTHRTVSMHARASSLEHKQQGKQLGSAVHTARDAVPCAPLSYYLGLAALQHITVFSLSGEGSELEVLQSVDWVVFSVAILAVEHTRTPTREPANAAVTRFIESNAGLLRVHETCYYAPQGVHEPRQLASNSSTPDLGSGKICNEYFVNPRSVDLPTVLAAVAGQPGLVARHQHHTRPQSSCRREEAS